MTGNSIISMNMRATMGIETSGGYKIVLNHPLDTVVNNSLVYTIPLS